MNDPHVRRLFYRVVASQIVLYTNCPRITVAAPFFNGTLSDDVLTCDLTAHFHSEKEAREAIEDYLAAWEIQAGLNRARPELTFNFWRAEVIDRDPKPNTVRSMIGALGVSISGSVGVSGDLSMQVNAGSYPAPPTGFRAGAQVRILWNRYVRFLEGREPLPAMAYFCLTTFERDAGSRRDAASKFNVGIGVLGKLGELASTRGGPDVARKAPPDLKTIPLTGEETAWLTAAVRLLILQAGYVEAGRNPRVLEMSDLPPI